MTDRQETFAHAIATSKDMTLRQKAHWLTESCKHYEEQIATLEAQLAAERQRTDHAEATAAVMETTALFLFDRLDRIDTVGDVAKSDDKFYRRLVEREHPRRFEVASTDGYKVTFKGNTDAGTALLERLRQAEATAAALREALAVYADEGNWVPSVASLQYKSEDAMTEDDYYWRWCGPEDPKTQDPRITAQSALKDSAGTALLERLRAAEAQSAAILSIFDSPDLLEKLSRVAHESWASWTRWMMEKWDATVDGKRYPEGELFRQRWRRQIETEYADLSEPEKESDRREVVKYLAVIRAAIKAALGTEGKSG